MFFDADVTTYENNSSMKEVNSNEELYLGSLSTAMPERQVSMFKSAEKMIQAFIDLQPALSFGCMLIENRDNVYAMLRIILSRFDIVIQEKLLTLVNWLIGQVIKDTGTNLKRLFPDSELYIVFVNYVINFFKLKVSDLELEYQAKRAAAKVDFQMSDKEYDSICAGFRTDWERWVYFFQICVLKMFSAKGNVEEVVCKEIVKFFWDWLHVQTCKYLVKCEKKPTNCQKKKIPCNICGGFYFE